MWGLGVGEQDTGSLVLICKTWLLILPRGLLGAFNV